MLPGFTFQNEILKKERKKLKEHKEQKQTVAILNVRPSLRSRRAKRKQRVFSSRSCVQAAAAAAAGPARTALNRFLSPAIKRHGADALASLLMRGVLPWHVHRSIPDKSRGSRRLVRPVWSFSSVRGDSSPTVSSAAPSYMESCCVTRSSAASCSFQSRC